MTKLLARASRAAVPEMLGCTLFWGAFFVAGKVAVREAAPLVVATLRFALAASALLVLLAWREPRSLRVARGDLPLAFALGATGVALYNVLAFFGFAFAPASDGAMISPGLNPVVTAFAAAPLFGERLTRARAIGLALALVGIAFIFGGPALREAAGPGRLLGDLLFVLSALAWSAYTLLGKLTVGRFSALASTTYAAVTGLLLLLPLAARDLWRTNFGALSAVFWMDIAILALFCTVAAFLLWYRALEKVGAARTASYLPLVPIFGVTLGIALLGDRPSGLQLGGMALAVFGVFWANRPGAVRTGRGGPPLAAAGST